VNVFAVQGPRGWTLIDAALTASAARITHWAQEHVSRNPPRAIVLTHSHFDHIGDHIGALEVLREQWEAPVYVHPDELPT